MNNKQTTTLGSKLRYFRKRAGYSQFQLENEIGASAGSISRIENGEVNPTKETLRTIVRKLSLNSRESRYLNGDLAALETNEDINKAIREVESYFNKKNVLAYLTDSRMRIHYSSKAFLDSLDIDRTFVQENVYGKSLIELLLNPDLKVNTIISESSLQETIYHLLIRFYNECGFMHDDPIYKETINIINEYNLSKKLWPEAQRSSFELLNSVNARQVGFKMYGVTVNMSYSVESLAIDNRFDIVEYVPTNKLLKLLVKF